MSILALLLLSVCVTDTTDDRRDELLAAVHAYVGPLELSWDPATARIAWADLNADGRHDALVTLTGVDWCGSGGCTLLVFEAMDEADADEMGPFRPAAEISLVGGPVHVARSCGVWSDLVIEGERGLRVLRFDGETYPLSPDDGDPHVGPLPPGTTFFGDRQ